ncbi:MAG: YgiQ family radical SAM protein [Candidatus Muirbacterium halophilum]|nr:YgiQ family radical SAM protein [Candidatus Muirbacterium halophilum]MCK9474738.1 YgiQ family radical SAM protein [Candidatus Muirbacterium halophilum]
MIIKLNEKKPDIILITGDYYVDHPNFGIAIIARILQNQGYSIWILSLPDPENNFEEFKNLPEPNLFFGITGGNIDSTLNLYTVNKVKRTQNVYIPEGFKNTAVKNASIEYSNRIRSLFKKSFIVLGGVESSNRRFAHYDFFTEKLHPSILENSAADIISYGMSDNTIVNIAEKIKNNKINDIFKLNGIVHRNIEILNDISDNEKKFICDFETLKQKPNKFHSETEKIYNLSQSDSPYYIVQKQLKHTIIVNPPAKTLNVEEMDKIYSLPYTYKPLPETKSIIKAFETIKNTVVTHRGCGGGCSFCSITLNQGKRISERSVNNIINEIKVRKLKVVSDIQAPTSNMYGFNCKNKNYCSKNSCVYPEICHFLDIGDKKYITLLNELKKLNKKIFVASGIRYDFLSEKILSILIKDGFIGGQMKIAPENTDNNILKNMFKPPLKKLEEFVKLFNIKKKELKKDIYLIPYIISSYPGANIQNTKKMEKDLKRLFGQVPYQIQDFTPTPGTIATALYYSGKVKIVKSKKERAFLRNILQEGKEYNAKIKNKKTSYKDKSKRSYK